MARHAGDHHVQHDHDLLGRPISIMRSHTTTLRVRYDECDPMGLVHHSNYLRYFEIGRTELLRASGGCYRDMESAGQLVVVAKIDCRYRRPAKYDDLLEIETTIAKVTAGKIIHQYRVLRDDEVLVESTVTLAVIDRDGNLQRVPAALIQQYDSWQNETERNDDG